MGLPTDQSEAHRWLAWGSFHNYQVGAQYYYCTCYVVPGSMHLVFSRDTDNLTVYSEYLIVNRLTLKKMAFLQEGES